MVVGKGEGAQLAFACEFEVFLDGCEGVVAPLAVEVEFEGGVFRHGGFFFVGDCV